MHAPLRPVLLLATLVGSACAHTARVESDPPGAEVFVDGEKVGVTPVDIEDPPGWSRRYEVTIKKDGYDLKNVTLEQDEFNTPMLVAAACTGACSCGLGALYFVPRSRKLLERYNYALKRRDPLPPVEDSAPPVDATPTPPAAVVAPPVSPPGAPAVVPQGLSRPRSFNY